MIIYLSHLFEFLRQLQKILKNFQKAKYALELCRFMGFLIIQNIW